MALAVTAVLLALGYYTLRLTHHHGTNPVAERYRSALHIGNAISRYADQHSGQLPPSLSALVPNYISYSNLDWFFWPPKAIHVNVNPKDFNSACTLVDREGSFTYLGQSGIKVDMILYDRRDLWPAERSNILVTTLEATNFIPRLRSPADIETRLMAIHGTGSAK